MSRRRKTVQRASIKKKPNGYSYEPLNLNTIYVLLSAVLLRISDIFVGLFKGLIMMVGKRDFAAGEDPGLSDRKRARLVNKQSKVRAEYSLVVKKEVGEPQETDSRIKLGEEEFKKMKAELTARKRSLMHLPRFWLNSTTGISASVFSMDYANRTPLLLSDIEHLVTYAYGGNALVSPPSRWCSMLKPNRLNNIVVVVVDGIGLPQFVDNEECFTGIMEVFGGDGGNRAIVEFLSPCWYGSTLDGEVSDWEIIGGQQRSAEPEQTPSDTAAETPTNHSFEVVLNQLRYVFPITGKLKKKKQSPPPTDTFPRTHLILTLPQLIQENCPMPIPSSSVSKFAFVPTCDSYVPVNPCSKLFSVDCEMCSTAEDPQALTKIAIVDEDLNTVYETLVKPEGEITDYLTRWSGITKDMMDGVTVTLEDVQQRVREIVSQHPDCVFIGQSLNCDLKALRMTHPYVIDTSVIFNLTGVEGRKSSLRDLALNLINEEIQGSGDKKAEGHCPVEDATAAMKLVKAKLENGFTFGNALKNSSFLCQSTKLSLDPLFTHSSFRQNKLDKNVLLVSQFSPPEQVPGQHEKQKQLITRLVSDSNGSTIKQISTRIYEQFMSIGFYSIRKQEEDQARKSMQKLDKRISKLFSNLAQNTLLLLICNKSHDNAASSDTRKRNNGVAFVRCKVSDSARRRD